MNGSGRCPPQIVRRSRVRCRSGVARSRLLEPIDRVGLAVSDEPADRRANLSNPESIASEKEIAEETESRKCDPRLCGACELPDRERDHEDDGPCADSADEETYHGASSSAKPFTENDRGHRNRSSPEEPI